MENSVTNDQLRVHDVCHTNDRVLRPRFSRPVLPLLDCRPPKLVCIAPEGGTYARNFCAKDRCLCSAARWRHWFPYERDRDTTAGGAYMTSTHEWPSLVAFPACPSASWLQVLNTSARCTRRGTYTVGFSYSLYLSQNPIAGGQEQRETLEVGGAVTTGTTPIWSLSVQREVWATDLGSPTFAVRQEQASEVSSTPGRSAAYAVTRQMPLDCSPLRGRAEVAAGLFVA